MKKSNLVAVSVAGAIWGFVCTGSAGTMLVPENPGEVPPRQGVTLYTPEQLAAHIRPDEQKIVDAYNSYGQTPFYTWRNHISHARALLNDQTSPAAIIKSKLETKYNEIMAIAQARLEFLRYGAEGWQLSAEDQKIVDAYNSYGQISAFEWGDNIFRARALLNDQTSPILALKSKLEARYNEIMAIVQARRGLL